MEIGTVLEGICLFFDAAHKIHGVPAWLRKDSTQEGAFMKVRSSAAKLTESSLSLGAVIIQKSTTFMIV